MSVDLSNMFRYPYSKLLGNLPCGKTPTPQPWLNVGAPKNEPVPLRNENCGTAQGCTPRLRFYDGDSDLAMSRKILKQSNNRSFYNNAVISEYTGSSWTRGGVSSGLSGFTPTALNYSGQEIDPGVITPFRALMNAGDPNGSYNAYVLGNCSTTTNGNCKPRGWGISLYDNMYVNAINQVSSTARSSNASAVRLAGAVPQGNIDNRETHSLWSGNNKWVYDGSDYVRFKKLQAKNRNFNDVSWGGDRHSASQTALSRVRR